jgi:hypothetical protein
MSLLTHEEETQRRMLFQHLPFAKESHPVIKNSLKRRYDALIEITQKRSRWSLLTYFALGLRLGEPIIHAMNWVLTSSDMNILLETLSWSSSEPSPKIITAPFTNSYLSQFLMVDLSSLSGKEMAYWFKRMAWAKTQDEWRGSLDYLFRHLHRLEKGQDRIFRGKWREIHERLKKSLVVTQTYYRELSRI